MKNMCESINDDNYNDIKFVTQPNDDNINKQKSLSFHLINYAKKLHRKRCTKYIFCKTCCEYDSECSNTIL